MKKRFCPKCGATNKSFVKGFCRNCFLETHSLIEALPELEIVQCRDCNKLLLAGKWRVFSEECLADWVKNKIKTKELKKVRITLEPNVTEKTRIIVIGKLLGEIENQLMEFPFSVSIRLQQLLCPNCTRLSGQYYEAVLQLRFDALPQKKWRTVLELVETGLQHLFHRDSLAKITRRVKLRNGFDLFIGSKRASKLIAEKLVSKFGGKLKTSFSLAGMDKSGRQRKRFTFLVRI